jgi:hypothetical protein
VVEFVKKLAEMGKRWGVAFFCFFFLKIGLWRCKVLISTCGPHPGFVLHQIREFAVPANFSSTFGLPVEIGKLTNLTEFYLQRNELTSVPAAWGQTRVSRQ